MTNDELLRRLNDQEDNFVERKTEGAANSDEIRKTMVAFANTVPEGREAILFIGILNKGTISGVANSDSLQKTVRMARDKCYPRIEYTVEVLSIDDKLVVAVVIPQSGNRPHFTGPSFVRIGSETVEASAEMFDELIFSRNAKCRAILKRRDKVVTVRARGKKLGDPRVLNDPYGLTRYECRILSCDAHVLRMYDHTTKRNVAEPLKNVTIDWDETKNRLALTVQAG